MLIPDQLLYTVDHLWVEIKEGHARVGLTDYAQELLGTISFIELPIPEQKLKKQSKLATIEGLKSVIDIFSPFECTVLQANQALNTEPKLINSSPYSEGWIAELTITDTDGTGTLLSASAYRSKITP
jgi:glycine cleavage system H protein